MSQSRRIRVSVRLLVVSSIFFSMGLMFWTPEPLIANQSDITNFRTKYPSATNSRIDSCSLCHSSGAYKTAYTNAGRDLAALGAIEAFDSDGDGWSNLAEIQALTLPGDATDKPSGGVTLTPTVDGKKGASGTNVTYTLTLTNVAQAADTFNVTGTGNAWSTSFAASVGPVAANASSNLTITVSIPANTAPGATDTVVIKATSTAFATKIAEATLTTTGPNAVPTLTSLSPSAVTTGANGFNLTVNGTGFLAGTIVRWNGTDRTTTFASSTRLTATIPASDVATAGTAQVTVFNPAPGGGASSAQTFTINNPAPTVTTLSPSSFPSGGAAFTLTVDGTNFIAGSVVRFKGVDRATTFVSSTRVTAAIPAADIATEESGVVTVFNPSPGGGLSNAVSFTTTPANPVPALTSVLAPASALAGRSTFILALLGTNFVGSSVVRWNGSDRETFFDGSTNISVRILAADVVSAGTAQLTVFNPGPGGGLSNALTYTINNRVPSIGTLSPSSATAGGSGFTLTVNGAFFASNSVIRWNGADRTTTVVSSSQLTASIPAADIATAGTANVTVFNPAPGGGVSNALTFTIAAPLSISGVTPGSVTLSAGNTTPQTLTVSLARSNFAGSVTLSLSALPSGVTAGFTQPGTGNSGTISLQAAGNASFVSFETITITAAGTGAPSATQTFFLSVSPLDGSIITLAGTGDSGSAGDNGQAINANFTFPTGVALDAAGNIYIADSNNWRIRKISTGGTITTVAGNGVFGFSGDNGPATSAQLALPYAVAVDGAGNLYISDSSNSRVRKVTPGGTITTIAGSDGTTLGDNGQATSAQLNGPRGIALDSAGNVYIATVNDYRVRKINVSTGIITTVAGNGTQGFSGDTGSATNAQLQNPTGVAVDAAGNLFILDAARVRKVDTNGNITTVVGTGTAGYTGDGGPAASASISVSNFLSVDASGNLFIADFGNHAVRKVRASDGIIETVAGIGTQGFSGDGGPATSAQLRGPWGVAVDAAGSVVIADTNNHRIRKVIAANPGPLVTSLSPSSVAYGGSGFTLTVNGTKFIPGSVVRWNGVDRTTTFVNVIQLTAAIPGSDIAAVGTSQITVFSPSPGGGASSALTFNINNPAPTLTTLSPSTVQAGGSGLILTVTGTNFISGAIVRWNGQDRTTTFVNSTQLTADIPSTDLTAGTAQVTVFNPAPGGGLTAALSFAITVPPNPVPSITSLSPATVQAGASAFTLTVNGAGFINGSVVRWNGVSRTTTFVSNTQLTIAVPASDLGVGGAIAVTVNNPEPGGGTSNALTFTITPASNPLPAITALSPAAAAVGAAGFTLTVNGSNFISGSLVRWNSADRTTTFVSGTQLTTTIPSSDIAAADVAEVTVFNPGPGGGTSNILTFNVNALRAPSRPTGAILEKWSDSTFPMTWRLNTTPGSNVTGARNVLDIFRLAFTAWDNVSTAQISFTEGAATSVTDPTFDQFNTISLSPVPFGSDLMSLTILYSFDQTGVDQFGRTIQFPGQILEADILFNPGTQFSTELNTPADKIDLQSLATHEIGHLLGLDHSGLVSSVMSRTLPPGTSHLRALSSDDVIRVSNLYPTSTFFSSKGSLSGVVRKVGGSPVFGAHVTVVDSTGRPVTATITGTDGVYRIDGLEPGNYSAYAEPLDSPLTPAAVPSLARIFAGASAAGDFTTRFLTTSAPAALTIAKTGGDNQKENIGKVLPLPLEVQVRDSSGNPVAGVSVFFTGSGGGGTVVPSIAITNAEGKARAKAYLGTGASQTFKASANDATVTFTATLP